MIHKLGSENMRRTDQEVLEMLSKVIHGLNC